MNWKYEKNLSHEKALLIWYLYGWQTENKNNLKLAKVYIGKFIYLWIDRFNSSNNESDNSKPKLITY